MAPVAPEPPPRRTLAERQTPKLETLAAARTKVLDAMGRARTLAAAKKPADALAVLAEIRSLDPLGAALAVQASRAAASAANTSLAVQWARVALDSAPGPAARDAAKALLEKSSAPLTPSGAGKVGAFGSIELACTALEERLRHEAAPPAGLGPVAQAKCEVEYQLDLAVPALERATAFRVDSADRTLTRAWVGLHTASGIEVYGPVAAALSPRETGLVNDFVVDLQKVDVLPGGGPEVVVKIDERRTLADVALNELAEVDQTRVLLLSLDRGKLEASREFWLSQTERRKLADPKDRRLPAGFQPSPKPDTDVSFAMKVAWTGANEITLTQASGGAEPRDSGRIVLFP